MPIVFMLEKPTRKRLRCISRVACEGYVLYAQKPAQGGGSVFTRPRGHKYTVNPRYFE